MWITILMCVFNWREGIKFDVRMEYTQYLPINTTLTNWSSKWSKIGKENPEGMNGTRLISLTIAERCLHAYKWRRGRKTREGNQT